MCDKEDDYSKLNSCRINGLLQNFLPGAKPTDSAKQEESDDEWLNELLWNLIYSYDARLKPNFNLTHSVLRRFAEKESATAFFDDTRSFDVAMHRLKSYLQTHDPKR